MRKTNDLRSTMTITVNAASRIALNSKAKALFRWCGSKISLKKSTIKGVALIEI